MKGKHLVFIFLITSAIVCGTSTINPVIADPDTVEFWALIVCGKYALVEPYFAADAAFMYHVLSTNYSFNGIYYLHANPTIDPNATDTATKENMRWAITNWLDQSSDSNDMIFIFWTGHGAGYNSYYNEVQGLEEPERAIDGSRGDPVDEGNEVWDATAGEWVGFDECLKFQHGSDRTYWDDEIKDDLNYLASRAKYGKLIFVSVACYSGGLIDDLSDDGERPRIIMTSANETRTSRMGTPDSDWFNEWSECFIEALHGEEVNWDFDEHRLIHTGIPVDADWSNDENMSMWEAWDYAWKNDYWRQNGYETPWNDDNGNNLPNYEEGSDMLDSYDDLLSMETYFGSGNLKSADVNDDAIVNIKDQAIVAKAYGSYPGHPRWNPLADLNNDTVVNILDVSHVSLHYGKWYPPGSGSKGAQTSSALLEGTTSLSLHPNEIKVHENEVFSVDVNVAGVTDIYSYEFKIYYDKTVLSCVDVNLPKGHFLEPINDPNNIYIAKMEYDNAYNATHGRIWVAVTLLGDEPGKNGDGTLVTITFTAKTKGKPILTLQDIILVQAKSLNFPTGPSTPP